MTELWPRWGIDLADEPVNIVTRFRRDAPRVLDIGFGNGEALITCAANFPQIDYLGIEIHEPGIGHLLMLIERSGVTNIRVIRRDAVDVIERMLAPESFDAINLFFPDPWPKKRHHKRRLVQQPFLGSAARILKPGGLLHIATDWADYAEQIESLFAGSRDFEAVNPDTLAGSPLAFRPPTRFERRGRQLGHEVADFFYRKVRND